MADWAVLQHNLGVSFQDLSILQQAFVHRSYLNENPDFALASNERMEFLGDALLSFVVAERLHQQFADLDEGEMTKLRALLVSKDNLARVASSLSLGEYLYLGQGEERGGGQRKPRTLACVLEALIGAVFIDLGLSVARDFIWRLLDDDLDQAIRNGLTSDHKTRLQEMSQAGQKGIPVYKVVDVTGPNHDRRFTVDVLVDGSVLGRGSGRSKRSAEKEAARVALDRLSPEWSP
jgi:ribonuclease-3